MFSKFEMVGRTSIGFDDWLAGRCIYACAICSDGKEYRDSFVFWSHVKTQHQMDLKTFAKRDPNYCKRKEFVTCK